MKMRIAARLARASAFCLLATLAACSDDDDSPPAAPVVAITASPTTLLLGAGATINWSSTNATSCSASGSWSGAKAANGTETVTPTTAGIANYTLTCQGAGGSANASVAVTVNVPPTVTLAASPETIMLGDPTTLTWSSTNATACTASDSWSGAKGPNGNESVTPSAVGDAKYTLTCTGPGGSISGTATVAVKGPTQFVYIAHTSGGVSAYSIELPSGVPVEIAGSPFPSGADARSIAVSPNRSFIYVGNYGSNNISVYQRDQATGALTPIAGSPFATGRRPTFIAIHPSGKFAYVSTQQDDLLTYAIDASGALTSVGSAVPGTSFVAIHPSGKFAYSTSSNSVTPTGVFGYTVDSGTGALTAMAGSSQFAAGTTPLPVAINREGKFAYVANINSRDVSAYTINDATGALTQISGSPVATGGVAPARLAFHPSGKFVYVANAGGPVNFSVVSGYAIDAATGALSALPGSPFEAGWGAGTVLVDETGKFAYVGTDGTSLRVYAISDTGALADIPGSPFHIASGTIAEAVLTR